MLRRLLGGVRLLIVAGIVLAVIGAVIYVYARPSYKPNQAKAESLTAACVDEDARLSDDGEGTKRARKHFGIPAIAINHQDFQVSAFFAASLGDAEKVEASLRMEVASDEAEGLDTDLARAVDEGRIRRADTVVLIYRDLPTREARAAFARCIYSYETARWTDTLGFELATIGRPFLKEAEAVAKAPARNPIEADLEALQQFTVRWGELSGKAVDIMNEGAEMKPDEKGTEYVRDELPAALDALLAEGKRARAGLEAASPSTEFGRELRGIFLETLRRQDALAADLHSALRRGGRIWGPIVTYGEGTSAERERLGDELGALVESIPARERAQIVQLLRSAGG